MRFTFMKQDTVPPDYCQFSRFLMETNLSQTARILYMLLLDRTKRAMNEHWIDRMGNVFVVYPIVEIAETCGRRETAVKHALKELESKGMIVRTSGGFAKPNHIYVRVPDEDAKPHFSPRIEMHKAEKR